MKCYQQTLNYDTMESLFSVLILAEVFFVCNQFHGLGKLLLYVLVI